MGAAAVRRGTGGGRWARMYTRERGSVRNRIVRTIRIVGTAILVVSLALYLLFVICSDFADKFVNG